MRAADASIVGSGPNGLAAAVRLAQAGMHVTVFEGSGRMGGGVSSGELTLPGFVHDICSAVHPLAAVSPFLVSLPLERHGLRWIRSPAALAHPFDDGGAALLWPSLEKTAEDLGEDAKAYRRWIGPLARQGLGLFEELLAPLHLPRRPLALARFGMLGIGSGEATARLVFRGRKARALYLGICAHSGTPLTQAPSSAIGLILLVAAHVAPGWPFPEGGASRLSEAIAGHLRELGGEIRTGARVRSLQELEQSNLALLDTSPRALLELAGEQLRPAYRRELERFRYGCGVFKMDWALSGPIPWKSPECRLAATVHLGGEWEELVVSEDAVGRGQVPQRPFVLLTQPSLFDPSRAPDGKHTAWAYCHVPAGCTLDVSQAIESQIERFAPGFRSLILKRHAMSPRDLEDHNPNYVDGDISGGEVNLKQLFFRPSWRPDPYRTPLPGVLLCSASTPPGSGVHGMCGFHAAESALRQIRRLRA